MGDSWWLESKGYEKEQSNRGKEQAANQKLLAVLEVFGLELHDGWVQSDNTWHPINCPFHVDVHKSAGIHLGKMWFHCHACGIGGRAVSIVMSQKGLSKKEAVEWISRNV